MDIVEDILNKAGRSFYPVDEDEQHKAAFDAQVAKPIQDVQPVNKWWRSKEESDYLISGGKTPEKIDYGLSKFDPSKTGSAFMDMYQSAKPVPDPVDEKKLKRRKTMATIADSIGLLAEMFSHSKGAHIKERSPENSASAKTEKEERELRELYRKQKDDYDAGVYDARTKDLLKAMRDHEAEGKEIWALLDEFDKERAAAAEVDRKRVIEETKHSNRLQQQGGIRFAAPWWNGGNQLDEWDSNYMKSPKK
jgi:hypothetical protein